MILKIIVWWCELCETSVPLRDTEGRTVARCTGGHPDRNDTTGRRFTADHWPTAMVRRGELSGLPEDVAEDTSGWAVLTPHYPGPGESARLAAEAAERRRSEGYRYLEVGRRLSDAPGGAEAVG